jgi:hypothetical protein
LATDYGCERTGVKIKTLFIERTADGLLDLAVRAKALKHDLLMKMAPDLFVFDFYDQRFANFIFARKSAAALGAVINNQCLLGS